MFISSSGMPERVTCKISGRYVPISPTYDRNEFDQIYNKETHQNSFFEFLSKFHLILDFFIAKLLSKLKIYTNSKKKFKISQKLGRKIRKNHDFRRKKFRFFFNKFWFFSFSKYKITPNSWRNRRQNSKSGRCRRDRSKFSPNFHQFFTKFSLNFIKYRMVLVRFLIESVHFLHKFNEYARVQLEARRGKIQKIQRLKKKLKISKNNRRKKTKKNSIFLIIYRKIEAFGPPDYWVVPGRAPRAPTRPHGTKKCVS